MNLITYAYLDLRKTGVWTTTNFTFFFEPFYIGEGKESRKLDHLKDRRHSHKVHRIQEIVKDGSIPIIITLASELSKKESVALETLFIKEIGTRAIIPNVPRGPLTNLRITEKDGNISDETKQKMSTSKLGKKFSDAHRLNLSLARRGRSYARTNTKPLSSEHKSKLSKAMKGRVFSQESLKRMSDAQRGHAVSAEQKAKISASCKGRKSPNAKRWQVTVDGTSIIIDSLRDWCIKHNVRYSSLMNGVKDGVTIRPYKGISVLQLNEF